MLRRGQQHALVAILELFRLAKLFRVQRVAQEHLALLDNKLAKHVNLESSQLKIQEVQRVTLALLDTALRKAR